MASFPKLCLRWNNHTVNLLDTLNSLLSSEQHSDVTLACQGQVWHLHRLVLSASSSHFAGLLAEVTPGQSPLIIVDGPTAHDMAAVIRFIYNGEVSVDQEHLHELLKTAAALKIKGLAEFPIEGAPMCHATVAGDSLQEDTACDYPHPHEAHDEKFGVGDNNPNYPGGDLSTELNATREQEAVQDAEVQPLNLSCKRDSYGETIHRDLPCISEGCEDVNRVSLFHENQAVLANVALDGSLKDLSKPQVVQDYSKETLNNNPGSFCKYASSGGVSTLDSNPSYVMLDVPSKSDLLDRNPSDYLTAATPSPDIYCDGNSWKPSQSLIREARPLVLSDTCYHIPATYSVQAPSIATTSLQIPVIKEVSTSTHIYPQPPKRLRTMEPAVQSLASPSSTSEHGSAVPVTLVAAAVPPTACVAVLNPSIQQPGFYSLEIKSQSKCPVKKFQERVSVGQMPTIKTEDAIDVRPPVPEQQGKIPNISPISNYKFVSIKSENFNKNEIIHHTNEPSNILESKLMKKHHDIKQELIPLKNSPPLHPSDSLSEDFKLSNNPIRSSTLLPSKNVCASVPALTVPNPCIKSCVSPQPITTLHEMEVTTQVPTLSPLQSSMLPNVFSRSPVAQDQKPVLFKTITKDVKEPTNKLVICTESPSQFVPCISRGAEGNTSSSTQSSACFTSSISSTAGSAPACTTAVSPSGSALAVSSETSSGSGQRVSVNMRTFKEEWRRQLLVDYDPRTNMSICMLCYTTFKSYDGPRKNTYVKHAKRFHTVLDDYTEDERDTIIRNYEYQYKYDTDRQKEVNKSFRCSGGGSGNGSSCGIRGGKSCRATLPPGEAGTGSSGSSTGSSLPGSRPETDGEDDNPSHSTGKSRPETPDSDGVLEVHDVAAPGPSSAEAGAPYSAESEGSPTSAVPFGTSGGVPSVSSVSAGDCVSSESSYRKSCGSSVCSNTPTAGVPVSLPTTAYVTSNMRTGAPGSLCVYSVSSAKTPGVQRAPISSGSPSSLPVSITVPAHVSPSVPSMQASEGATRPVAASYLPPTSTLSNIPSSSTLVFTNLIPLSTSSSSYTAVNVYASRCASQATNIQSSAPYLLHSGEPKVNINNNNNVNSICAGPTVNPDTRSRIKCYSQPITLSTQADTFSAHAESSSTSDFVVRSNPVTLQRVGDSTASSSIKRMRTLEENNTPGSYTHLSATAFVTRNPSAGTTAATRTIFTAALSTANTTTRTTLTTPAVRNTTAGTLSSSTRTTLTASVAAPTALSIIGGTATATRSSSTTGAAPMTRSTSSISSSDNSEPNTSVTVAAL